MRYLLLLSIFCTVLLAKPTTDRKIKQANKTIKKYDKAYKRTHNKFLNSARSIKKEQESVQKYSQKLQQLESLIDAKKVLYKTSKNDLEILKKRYKTLINTQKETQNVFSKLMAKELSLHIILQQKAFSDAKSLMRSKMFEAMSRLTQEDLKHVQDKLFTLTHSQTDLHKQINTLNITIQSIDQKRNEVNTLKTKHLEAINSLKIKRTNYKASLEIAYNKKISMRRTLQKLHIMKEKEIKKARIAKAKQEALRKAKRKQKTSTKKLSQTKIKKYSNLYSKTKTKRYRGKKTISPIKGYRVVKRYGPYIDPIYKIKIFNESISLKPKRANTSVRSVLNGKIILVKKTQLLGNFIIIEHAHGLHTIYSHLDKVVPGLRKGKRIKKGHLIGKVSNELTFEVTQKNYHINPLELIQ